MAEQTTGALREEVLQCCSSFHFLPLRCCSLGTKRETVEEQEARLAAFGAELEKSGDVKKETKDVNEDGK